MRADFNKQRLSIPRLVMSMPEHGRAPGGGAQHRDHKAYSSRDTLGYEVGKAKARPRNTSVGGLHGGGAGILGEY